MSDFTVTWYPGKLNSLTFNGKIGDQAREFLINPCLAVSTSIQPEENIHEQTELRLNIENFGLD